MPSLSHAEILHYSRHLLIPEVGLTGQRRLKTASILIIGTGGLGSPIAMYLAAAGVGHLGVMDYDRVDVSNLQRQIIHGSASVGEPKVLSAKRRLADINSAIEVTIYDEPLTSENALRVAEPYDILIDATDNFPTRYLLNDVAVLSKKPMVYGSIYQFEGQVSVFWAGKGPCYRCIFPDPPPPELVPDCGEAGVFGVLPGTIGTIQATEALKLALGIGTPLIGKLLLYDAQAMQFEEIRLHRNPRCRICSDKPEIDGLIDYEAFCGAPGYDRPALEFPSEHLITPEELSRKVAGGDRMHLIDVREPHELEISRIEGAECIPLGKIAAHLHELNPQEEIILLCRTGTRSGRALEILLGAGFKHARNLVGGVNAWAAAIDRNQPIY
ncbi:MAG: molybdopterin-synthase adenylyltransferase MoeB [Anaerolineales bacterium]|nr:molybdopterin-synthase adenylyltransferase MoeB [Anaerolineales bacterium]